MKRITFYVLLLLQIGIIALLGWQYTVIDNFGVTVKLLSDNTVDNDTNDIYITYEINTIPNDKWDSTSELKYNEKVYVLLEDDGTGIYHVLHASTKKMKPASNQIVFLGQFDYDDPSLGGKKVRYQIEHFHGNQAFNHVNLLHQEVVTMKVAPWGQKRIIGGE